MRRTFGSVAILSLFAATGALAADLPARVYAKAPVTVDPGYNWTGFYAGLNAGYSWGRANTTSMPTTALPPIRQDLNGALGGGQIGYNWQFNRNWVAGLEGDFQWTGERSYQSGTFVGPRLGAFLDGSFDPSPAPDFNTITNRTVNLAANLAWFATFRGRAGILADPQTLLYATGGLAVGEFKYSSQITLLRQLYGLGITGTIPAGPPFNFIGATLSETQTRVGWTVGAGIERKLSTNWSAKLEYLYLDFGSKTFFAGNANVVTNNQVDVSFHDHVVRAGINYAFNTTAVMAKY